MQKKETRDQETMMGTDMFAEERLAMNSRITRLQKEVKASDNKIDLLKKEKRELTSAKETQSHEIRQLRGENQWAR